MRSLKVIGMVLALAALAPHQVAAADAPAGRAKAIACQACHGLDGLSKNPEAPNLAGQVESYLVRSLNEYRTGARTNESMNIVAKGLSEADIADLAAYYAGIQIEVSSP